MYMKPYDNTKDNNVSKNKNEDLARMLKIEQLSYKNGMESNTVQCQNF